MVEMIDRDSIYYPQVMTLGETIHLVSEVNVVIESAGGWPVK